jgi:hypothetical protein
VPEPPKRSEPCRSGASSFAKRIEREQTVEKATGSCRRDPDLPPTCPPCRPIARARRPTTIRRRREARSATAHASVRRMASLFWFSPKPLHAFGSRKAALVEGMPTR